MSLDTPLARAVNVVEGPGRVDASENEDDSQACSVYSSSGPEAYDIHIAVLELITNEDAEEGCFDLIATFDEKVVSLGRKATREQCVKYLQHEDALPSSGKQPLSLRERDRLAAYLWVNRQSRAWSLHARHRSPRRPPLPRFLHPNPP